MAIQGHVNRDREAIVVLRVRSEVGTWVEVETVVDTGFTGYLTLPPSAISALRLRAIEAVRAQLADGSFANIQTFQATAMWHGKERRVVVCAAEGGPLLGMSLLHGSRLFVDVVDGGAVNIDER